MEQKTTLKSVFLNGIITENPTFRLVLGTCPTMAVTTSATNGIGMGAAATFVLVGSNTAWAHPVVFQRIEAAKKARPSLRVIVIDRLEPALIVLNSPITSSAVRIFRLFTSWMMSPFMIPIFW